MRIPFMKIQNISMHGFNVMLCTGKQQQNTMSFLFLNRFWSNLLQNYWFLDLNIFRHTLHLVGISLWEILKTIYSEMGDNLDKKKKNGSPIFSWGIHLWKLKTLAYMVLKLCYAQESNNKIQCVSYFLTNFDQTNIFRQTLHLVGISLWEILKTLMQKL